MGRPANNLIGQKFGSLTVLERDNNFTGKGVKWVCQCDCGKIKTIMGTLLINSHTKSCGCQIHKRHTEIIGKRFGRLVAIDFEEGSNRNIICRCDCGNTKTIILDNLTKGATTSCGCFHKEIVGKQFSKNLIGNRYGRLVVKSVVEKESKQKYYLCNCDCGNSVIVRGGSLTTGNTTSCGCYKSEVTSERFSLDLTGEKFGKLTVIERDGTFIGEDGSQYSYWKCKCECGTFK